MSRLQCHRKNNTLSVPSLLTAVRGVGGFGGAKGVPKDPVSSGENTTKVKCEKPSGNVVFFLVGVAGMKCILQFFLMTWSRQKSFVYRFVICVVLGTSHGVRAQRNDVLHTGPREAAKRHAGTNSGCPCWYCSDITDTTNSPNKENRHEVRSLILTPFVSSSTPFPKAICHRHWDFKVFLNYLSDIYWQLLILQSIFWCPSCPFLRFRLQREVTLYPCGMVNWWKISYLGNQWWMGCFPHGFQAV